MATDIAGFKFGKIKNKWTGESKVVFLIIGAILVGQFTGFIDVTEWRGASAAPIDEDDTALDDAYDGEGVDETTLPSEITVRIICPLKPAGSNPSSGTIYLCQDEELPETWGDSKNYETTDCVDYRSATNDGSVDFTGVDPDAVKGVYISPQTGYTELAVFMECDKDCLAANFQSSEALSFEGAMVTMALPQNGTPTISVTSTEDDGSVQADTVMGLTTENDTSETITSDFTIRAPKTKYVAIDEIRLSSVDINDGLTQLKYEGHEVFVTGYDPYDFTGSKNFVDTAAEGQDDFGLLEDQGNGEIVVTDGTLIVDTGTILLAPGESIEVEVVWKGSIKQVNSSNDDICYSGDGGSDAGEAAYTLDVRYNSLTLASKAMVC
jgi:hypothetical protein